MADYEYRAFIVITDGFGNFTVFGNESNVVLGFFNINMKLDQGDCGKTVKS